MTGATLVLAATLAAWGFVPAPASAPPRDGGGATNEAAALEPPPPPVPAPVAVKQLFDEPGRASILRRPPAPPSRPARPARPQLHRDWRFWAISGSAFAASVIVTILVTRPGPQPYPGNLPPNIISFP